MRQVLFVVFTILCLGWSQISEAQVYMKEKSRYRFAQTYVGLNTQFVPESGSLVWNNETTAFPATTIPRFTIGGLHFWGHLDFKINFSLAHFGDFLIDEITELEFRPGGDFSARYYPWQIQYGKIRPFIGFSLNQMVLEINSNRVGSRGDIFINVSPVGGISYAFNGWQLNAEVRWSPSHEVGFYTSRDVSSTFQLPPLYYSVGITKFFDTGLSEEKKIETGETEAIEKKIRSKGNLNSFSLGIAPSATYFFRSPRYQAVERQSVPGPKVNVNWDFGLGYLFYDAGWHVGLSYRSFSSIRESYELKHYYERTSWAAEAYKFIWDWNGFAPFVGLSLSREDWAAAEFEGNLQIGDTKRTEMISPGLIFGWDILYSSIDTWTLRTNLRYYPFMKIEDISGMQSRVDQFEFNFIQFVWYPNRTLSTRKARKMLNL